MRRATSLLVWFGLLEGLWLAFTGTPVMARALQPLRVSHGGHIGDYIAWLTLGTAVIGGLFAITIR